MIHLENVLKISLQDVLKMSWRRLQNVLKTSWRCLEDVFKTSWRHFEDVLARRLEDVFKTPCRCLEDVFEDALKTYGQDEYIGLDQDLLKTSSGDVRLRRTYSSWWRRLQDEDERRLQDVFKTNVCWVKTLWGHWHPWLSFRFEF